MLASENNFLLWSCINMYFLNAMMQVHCLCDRFYIVHVTLHLISLCKMKKCVLPHFK